ncbi:hypothetical protein HOC80_04370 [archaeon]|nr:hypothetical protein [archaeon]
MKKLMLCVVIITILIMSTASAGFFDFLTGKAIKEIDFDNAKPSIISKLFNRNYCIDSDEDLIDPSKEKGRVLTSTQTFEDYCIDTNHVKEYFCPKGLFKRSVFGSKTIECDADEICEDGACIDSCWDLDSGDHTVRGETIYEDPNNAILQVATESWTETEFVCELGALGYEYYTCQEDNLFGICLNKEDEWDYFMDWLQQKNYDPEIINYYEEKYENLDVEYSEALVSYSVFGNQIRDSNSFFNTYKNSLQNEPITIKLIEIYPLEQDWIYKKSSEQVADTLNQQIENYLQEKADRISVAFGRDIELEIEQITINYTEFFFCDDCDYTFVSQQDIVYVNNNTFLTYQEDYTWVEQNINGYIEIGEFIDEQRLYFISEDLVPLEPGATYVFMGGISPDNYYLGGVPQLETGCGADLYDSRVMCAEVGVAYTSMVHELGHLLSLPHSVVSGDANRPLGLPTVMFGSFDDWPCADSSYWYDEDYSITYAPHERYAIEPHEGFEDVEEFVYNYNEALLCP